MIISDDEAIRNILKGKGHWACYLGAGGSNEAGVMTSSQICEKIYKDRLGSGSIIPEKIKKVNRELNWENPNLRYTTCIKKEYPNQALRINYFRDIIRNIKPSFCHHGIALLMRRGFLKNTCLTTNFDKLLESAFTLQGELECQSIRTDEESKYWDQLERNRYNIIKLHGDYDTYNILNTDEETMKIKDDLIKKTKVLLEKSGLVVIGAAGYEESIYTLFNDLSSKAADPTGILSYGLLWGVYMGATKPKNLGLDEIENLIQDKIKQGVICPKIREIIEKGNKSNPLFCFYPVWGARNFIFDLIDATKDVDLIRTAELYLDHPMRLHSILTRAGLSEEGIDKHMSALDKRQTTFTQEPSDQEKARLAFKVNIKSGIELRIMYGDITNRPLMAEQEFMSLNRAILSPEDTFLTAGGGVAYILLLKAGKYKMLHEVAKFGPVDQGDIAVTSGGDLPMHYIFHAAALKILEDGSYIISNDSVRATITKALEKAYALGVNALWIPLLGSGTAGLNPEESFSSILESICNFNVNNYKLKVLVFSFKENDLSRETIRRSFEKTHIPSSQIYEIH